MWGETMFSLTCQALSEVNADAVQKLNKSSRSVVCFNYSFKPGHVTTVWSEWAMEHFISGGTFELKSLEEGLKIHEKWWVGTNNSHQVTRYQVLN